MYQTKYENCFVIFFIFSLIKSNSMVILCIEAEEWIKNISNENDNKTQYPNIRLKKKNAEIQIEECFKYKAVPNTHGVGGGFVVFLYRWAHVGPFGVSVRKGSALLTQKNSYKLTFIKKKKITVHKPQSDLYYN